MCGKGFGGGGKAVLVGHVLCRPYWVCSAEVTKKGQPGEMRCASCRLAPYRVTCLGWQC